MEFVKRELISIFSGELPGFSAQQEMTPLNRPLGDTLNIPGQNWQSSSVAILLYVKNSDIHTVLIERTKYKGAHSGQISFPGGKMEESDLNLEHTARRECAEEIKQDMSNALLIRQLSDIYIPVSNFKVSPFVFWLDGLSNLIAEEREVNSIIELNSKHLLNPNTVKRTDLTLNNGLIRKNVPYYDISGHVVWGATAMMLAELKMILARY